jgi:NAD(P)H dehydrogenase (quinone)
MSELIAVTGATGAVGGRVARRLADRGAAQRLVVRDPDRAPTLAGADVRTIAGYGDSAGMRAALEGVHTLFLVPAAEAPDRVEQHLTAVDAAAAAGVERIVYLSFVGAAPDSTFTLARHHYLTQERIRATGVPFTFVRMSLYMDFIPLMVGADGVIRGPAGNGRVGAVLRDDLADVCAVVLTEEGHDGQSYDVTGPEAFTLTEAAAEMARATGAPIRFEDETLEQAYASRAHYGAPDWEIEGWVSSYAAIGAGDLALVTDTVRRLAGHAPVRLADYLRTHPDSLEHVNRG